MKTAKTFGVLLAIFLLLCGVLIGGTNLLAGKDAMAQPGKEPAAQARPVQVKTFYTGIRFDEKEEKQINDFLADPTVEYVSSTHVGYGSGSGNQTLIIYYRKK
jgi:hypothetical protein